MTQAPKPKKLSQDQLNDRTVGHLMALHATVSALIDLHPAKQELDLHLTRVREFVVADMLTRLHSELVIHEFQGKLALLQKRCGMPAPK